MHTDEAPRNPYLGAYDDVTRWNSYWCQIECVKELRVKDLLEIGVGNKTVSNYLKMRGYRIITLDINRNLKPDVAGEITRLPFIDDRFDATLCYEVLEHIPFNKAEYALREMRRVSKYAIISLPHFSLYFSLTLKLPLTKPKNFVLRLPFPLRHKFNGEHHWEIGKRGYTTKTIRKLFRKCGFMILNEKTPALNPPHHFFILQRSLS